MGFFIIPLKLYDDSKCRNIGHSNTITPRTKEEIISNKLLHQEEKALRIDFKIGDVGNGKGEIRS